MMSRLTQVYVVKNIWGSLVYDKRPGQINGYFGISTDTVPSVGLLGQW